MEIHEQNMGLNQGDRNYFFLSTCAIVVIGCGLTAVNFFMRLRFKTFVSPVSPQPLVRVRARCYIVVSIPKGGGNGFNGSIYL